DSHCQSDERGDSGPDPTGSEQQCDEKKIHRGAPPQQRTQCVVKQYQYYKGYNGAQRTAKCHQNPLVGLRTSESRRSESRRMESRRAAARRAARLAAAARAESVSGTAPAAGGFPVVSGRRSGGRPPGICPPAVVSGVGERAARRAAASARAAAFAEESPADTMRFAASSAPTTLAQTLSSGFVARSGLRIITAPTSAGETA